MTFPGLLFLLPPPKIPPGWGGSIGLGSNYSKINRRRVEHTPVRLSFTQLLTGVNGIAISVSMSVDCLLSG